MGKTTLTMISHEGRYSILKYNHTIQTHALGLICVRRDGI